MGLTVVKAERAGDVLYVTIQGDSVEEVTSSKARKFAYEVRGDYGFENAGIEASGGPFPVDASTKDEDGQAGKPIQHDKIAEFSTPSHLGKIRYRHTYRLIRGL